jgi:hypothetical protein
MSRRLQMRTGSRVPRQVIASAAFVACGICYDREVALQEESGRKTVRYLARPIATAIAEDKP